MKTRQGNVLFITLVALVLAVAAWKFLEPDSSEKIFEPSSRVVEAANPCPWRNADSDLTNWFPNATSYTIRDLVLSSQRVELQERLGRDLIPGEMALHYYAVKSNQTDIGNVLTHRIKGQHGAIEIALAIDPQQQIRHFKIQSSREPEAVTSALATLDLDRHLKGHSLAGDLSAPLNIESTPPEARACAEQVTNAIHTLQVLWDAGHNHSNTHHH